MAQPREETENDQQRRRKTKTPGIFKRGSKYVVQWRDGPRQRSRSFDTLTEARKFKGQRATDTRASSREHFDDYARNWIENHAGHRRGGFSEATKLAYTDSLDRFAIPFFGRSKLGDIDRDRIKAFIRHLEGRSLEYSSVVKNLAVIKSLFASALDDSHVTVNPTANVRINTKRNEAPEQEKVKAMASDELAQVLWQIPAQYKPMFRLFAETGLRASEVFGLDNQHLDLSNPDRPMIHVRQSRNNVTGKVIGLKSDTSRRTLPISQSLAADLTSIRAEPTEPLFVTSRGTRFQNTNVSKILKKAVARTAINYSVSLHTFRHTYVSRMIAAGRNIIQVQHAVGHSDPALTARVYAHLLEDGTGDVLELPELSQETIMLTRDMTLVA